MLLVADTLTKTAIPLWFERVLFRSVQAGLCPLIPVPFLDDWAILRVKRWMVADAFARHGRSRDAAAERILAGSDEGRGLFQGAVLKVALKPVKWVFRKTFFVLSIKGGVDLAAQVFQEGYLLERALARGILDPGGSTSAQRVREATRVTCAALDPGPVRQILARAFEGSRDAVVGAATILGRMLWRQRRAERAVAEVAPAPAEALEEERLMAKLLAPVVHALWYREDHLAALASRFDGELRSRAGGGAGELLDRDPTSPSDPNDAFKHAD